MSTPAVKVVADADGGASLVGTVDGVKVVFATVNASQIHELRAAQGANEAETGEPDDDEAAE